MSCLEGLRGGREIDLEAIDPFRYHQLRALQRVSVPCAKDASTHIDGAAIGVDVGNSHHQINVQLIELHIERPGQAPRNLQGIFERVGGVDERVVSLFDLPLITGPRVEGEVGTADSGRRVLGIEDVGIAHADWAYLRQDSARGGPE